MRTEQIILVLSIAREHSLKKAADALFISQPNASSMLKSLERDLGYRIFERTNSGMELTREGYEFIEHAAAIERSLQAISQIRQPVRRIRLRILSLVFDFTETAFETLCEKYCSGGYATDFRYQIVNNTEEALALIENEKGDLAVAMCRKELYGSISLLAAKKHLTTIRLCDTHLDMTCRRGHPILQNGKIAFDLLGQYPGFSSVQGDYSEQYGPLILAKMAPSVLNRVIMDPGAARNRLLKKTDGYLVSLPLPEEILTSYDLESVPIPDSENTIFALYGKDSPRESLIREYLGYLPL